MTNGPTPSARSFSPISDSDFVHGLYFFFSSQSTRIITHKQDTHLCECTQTLLVFCQNLWMFGCFLSGLLFLSLLLIFKISSTIIQS